MTFARKTLAAALAAVTVSASTLATVGTAEAGHRGYYYNRGSSAGPVIAGVIGGLALGAIAASSARRSYAYDAGYGYAPVYGGGYGYSDYAPVYQTQCYRQKQRVYDNWGNYVGKRVVRVCN